MNNPIAFACADFNSVLQRFMNDDLPKPGKCPDLDKDFHGAYPAPALPDEQEGSWITLSQAKLMTHALADAFDLYFSGKLSTTDGDTFAKAYGRYAYCRNVVGGDKDRYYSDAQSSVLQSIVDAQIVWFDLFYATVLRLRDRSSSEPAVEERRETLHKVNRECLTWQNPLPIPYDYNFQVIATLTPISDLPDHGVN